MMKPLFRMYLNALPLAKLRTQVYFGHEGALLPGNDHVLGHLHQ